VFRPRHSGGRTTCEPGIDVRDIAPRNKVTKPPMPYTRPWR